ncbi:uncharacterized protein DUF2332 [Homoserinimonas aerilata]|uniref:Uncharacterized protein DUF2332 n=1 Tax=Homoserinimonas aerilata TaxID=1162970 RepID=A0A542YG46_9MICO|nr:DUF2332 domain-containing protein [Homoserinimonas aerilata]TQL47047.1 uncharacterized protein DUF2332 [Homoserinimonas aerilata]
MSPRPTAERDTAQWYRDFARQVAGVSPVYEAWADGIAGDVSIRALIDTLPEQKRQPPLVLATARLIGAAEGDYDGLAQFLRENWQQVATEAAVRPMQTNEPARCAALLPALAQIPGPIALLELGASAGLCLHPDRYSYDYNATRLDPAAGPSELLLHCDGNPPQPLRMPEIVWRAGIDLEPLDPAEPRDRDWLEALIWPGQHKRLARLRSAMTIAQADERMLVRGDAADKLDEVAGLAPDGSTLVIVTAGVLVYIPYAQRMRLVEKIRRLDASWVSLEGSAVLPDVAERLPAGSGAGRFVLALDGHPLAYAGPHGETLEPLAG